MQNERLKGHVVRDFDEMLLAKKVSLLSAEEQKSMEDSAIYHENRVSYLLGQHDLDILKSGIEKTTPGKRTNQDSSSASTAGYVGPSRLQTRE